ncbi:hypothetical protein [Legionella quinlivanii]|uniref:hypothetical protein n=1 Tax=Legionella quinlivanii TaxID=45073 RepID=UPI00224427C8|nr:hypothetical protein [Legionella quinlivanii]MCW8451653.1 hypothetical protein [Legionella quinlivanii]
MPLVEALKENNLELAISLILKGEELTADCVIAAYESGYGKVLTNLFIDMDELIVTDAVLCKLVDLSKAGDEAAEAALSLAIGLHRDDCLPAPVLSYAIENGYFNIFLLLDRADIQISHIESAIQINSELVPYLLKSFLKAQGPESLPPALLKNALIWAGHNRDIRFEMILEEFNVPIDDELLKQAVRSEEKTGRGTKIVDKAIAGNMNLPPLDEFIQHGNASRIHQLLEKGIDISPQSLGLAIQHYGLSGAALLAEHFEEKSDELVRLTDLKTFFDAMRSAESKDDIKQLLQLSGNILGSLYAKAEDFQESARSIRMLRQVAEAPVDSPAALPFIPSEIASTIAHNFFGAGHFRKEEIKAAIQSHYGKPELPDNKDASPAVQMK